MWIASALNQCTDLRAKHESMRKEFTQSFGGVESNGNFWQQIPEIRTLYPGAVVIHQVRDGRKVVRSVVSRKPHRTLEQACNRWVRRNGEMAGQIPEDHRFRLEDLTADFKTFEEMAHLLGATYVNPRQWNGIRAQRVNAYHSTFSAPEDWTKAQKQLFWTICGEMMERMGYGEELA